MRDQLNLSVITINYNNAEGLAETFDSLFCQTFVSYEYIVIDGGSADGSKLIIEQHHNKINHWVSEQDTGVYHAMNKGIATATGEYLLFLNSGDRLLHKDVLQEAFHVAFNEDIVYCNVRNNITREVISFPDELNFSFFIHATLNHQSTFIARRLFDKYGSYNEGNQIASDWEFFIRCIFLYHVSTRHLNLVLVDFDFSNGISAKPENYQRMINERKQILSIWFKGFIKDYEHTGQLQQELILRNKNSIRLNKWLLRFLQVLKLKI